jgi:hypothetical protein
MGDAQPAWWSIRRAQNLKPATYRCPLCGRHLPALSEHMLIAPEGDTQRRRHAHTACVLAARESGRLPTRDEWLKAQPRQPSLWRRVCTKLWRANSDSA